MNFNTILIDDLHARELPLRTALADLSHTLQELCCQVPEVVCGSAASLGGNQLLLGLVNGAGIRSMASLDVVELPALHTDGFWLHPVSTSSGKALLLAGGSIRGVCYGIYELNRRIRFARSLPSFFESRVVNPDLEWRMITEAFEVSGFPDVAKFPKPIVRPRSFDPMKPTDSAGYEPMDEAANLLRAGYNTFWVGNFSYAVDYDGFSPDLFPAGSERRSWLEERRSRLRENIRAAKAYHLNVCISSDVFVYPKGVEEKDREKLLEYALTTILTEYPEIDIVCTRYGENYSFFNPWFLGSGPHGHDEIARVTSLVRDVVVARFGRQYWCRTWWMENTNWHATPALYEEVSDNVKPDPGLAFSIKNTQTDFWRYNRFNPCIGKGKHPQILEYLCQDGYHLKGAIPYFEALRIASGAREISPGKNLDHAKNLGVKGAWGWLWADGWNGPYVQREEWVKANIHSFSRLCWDTRCNPRSLALEWASLEFRITLASKAAANLAEILLQSEELVLKTFYVHSYCKLHPGWLPHRNWMRDDVLGGIYSSYLEKELDAHEKAHGFKGHAFAPGTIQEMFSPETVEADCREKMEAVALAERAIGLIDEISCELPDQDQAAALRTTLEYQLYLVKTVAHYFCGAFRFLNGQKDQAIHHLKQWQAAWNYYCHEIPGKPGAPTPMVDGGMEKDCLDLLLRFGREIS